MSLKCVAILCLLIVKCLCEDKKPGAVLAESAAYLANLPLQEDNPEASALTGSGYVVGNPAREDLAISRLQDRVRVLVSTLWDNVNDPQRFATLKEKGATSEVLKIFAETLKNDVFALENQVDATKMEGLLQQIKIDGDREATLSWSESFETFQKIVGKINLLYGYLDGYFGTPSEASDIVLQDYARGILHPGLSQDMSVVASLASLHQLSVTSNSDDDRGNELHDGRKGRQLGGKRGVMRTDIFYKLHSILKNPDSEALCNLGQSPQQLLSNLYNLVALTEVKGFAMVQFSHLVLKIANRGNYTLETDLTNKNFDAQTTEKLSAVKTVLARTTRDVWACDPEKQVEGSTFVALKKLLQGHIENEVDMNSLGSCKDSCATYKIAERQTCFNNLFCAKQKSCEGRLFDCQFYHADSWVCMSNNPSRKYDWIEYEDGKILGNKDQCVNKIKVDSWWRWLFWHCSYCLCKCDAKGPESDRYWSLRPSVSDISSNKVITGARFVKKDRVIQIEIEEATALPEGIVDETTRKWTPVSPININDIKLKKDEDYMIMTYEQRAMDLDRMDAPPGHVITGIKLRSLGGHLNLEIQVTPITFGTGKLLNDRSTWVGNDNTPATIERRQQLKIVSPDIPTKYKGKSRIDSTHDQYVLFDTTSAEKDVMQTTIPYIDSQNVSPSPGIWISGAGLYHKGDIGYGGYIGIMLKTYDVSRHLMTKKDPSAYRQSRRKF